ncbi:hypothetical protein SAMD00019534_005910 [Acytostelium subglobosum LB1]|uniref:hypothetical protein n=1 Tax=Acytostelium subglobosum LB1 TaxID=1410327 RepID=UPI000644AACC|nr:hypothetical protein SAMD00019534_005910 [Acytostelium subglobosum LB1]GAM17416.1 hypothetical protein SAMD00019534_005910 [Acytostelium subglobosum LB1]|eukprot:XP_012759478.1 hypothetical protein SAMD00019534_005910 [Acytostelium subglobosum LB1]
MYSIRKLSILSTLILLSVFGHTSAQRPESYTIDAAIFDHLPSKNNNFEPDLAQSQGITPFLIKTTLDPKLGVPELNGTSDTYTKARITSPDLFPFFFSYNPNINKFIPYTLNFTLATNGSITGMYNMTKDPFFPINYLGWDTDPINRLYKDDMAKYQNFHFCIKLQSFFTYIGVEELTVTSDDDLWVFINGKLVIDLGGLHATAKGSLKLSSLNLTKGNTYSFDLFHCERHTASSSMSIITNMEIRCFAKDYCGVCNGDGSSCCVAGPGGECDDHDSCTIDACPTYNTPGANITNFKDYCTHSKFSCANQTAADPCYNWACDGSKCVVDSAKTCPSISCQVVDKCDAKEGGCLYKPLCTAPDACTITKCNAANQTCESTPLDCSGTNPNKCMDYSCDKKLGCVITAKNCEPQKPEDCTTYSCDRDIGCFPIYLNTTECACCDPTKTPNCMSAKCDEDSGKCIYADLIIDDGDICTDEECDHSTGVITYTPKKCLGCQACRASADGKCVDIDSNCNEGLCSIGKCTKGQCSFTPNKCDDGNPCTDDTCDPVAGCQHRNTSCPDKGLCQVGVCNSTLGGCSYSNRLCAAPSNFCNDTMCDAQLGCIQFAKQCVPPNPQCQQGVCNPTKQVCEYHNIDPLPTGSSYRVAVTIFDHLPSKNANFQPNCGGGLTTGLVKQKLNATLGIPEAGPANPATGCIGVPALFPTFFAETPNINVAIPYNLTFNLSGKTYSSGAPNDYFPINFQGWDTDPANRIYNDSTGHYQNFHFCIKLHTHFTFQGGESLTVTSDDDLWLYVNNTLVLDIGGIHTATTGVTPVLGTYLNLTKGATYPIDLFKCERQTDSSAFQISSNFVLECLMDYCGVCNGNGSTCCPMNNITAGVCNDNDLCTIDSCPPLNTPGVNSTNLKEYCIHRKISCDNETASDRCYNWSCKGGACAKDTAKTCPPINYNQMMTCRCTIMTFVAILLWTITTLDSVQALRSSYNVATTVFDHLPSLNNNFQPPCVDGQTNLVKQSLNATLGIPELGLAPPGIGCITNTSLFPTFFASAPNINMVVPYNLTFYLVNSTNNDGNYTAGTIAGFFPINYKGWDTNPANRIYNDSANDYQNFHYCLKLHTSFIFNGGEYFSVTSTDDFWMYVNNSLVIDNGGTHSSSFRTMPNLGTSLNLTKGNAYPLDIFKCNRKVGISAFLIMTDITMDCTVDYCGVCNGNGSTCCSASAGGQCNDNDQCTIDSCPPLNTPGVNTTNWKEHCIHTKITCDNQTASDRCYNWACQGGTCAKDTAKTCPPIKCKIVDKCDPDLGCQYLDDVGCPPSGAVTVNHYGYRLINYMYLILFVIVLLYQF